MDSTFGDGAYPAPLIFAASQEGVGAECQAGEPGDAQEYSESQGGLHALALSVSFLSYHARQ